VPTSRCREGPELSKAAIPQHRKPRVKRVEVPLTFDAEFFDILLDDVTSLDSLQTDEQKILSNEIVALSTEVTAVTKYEIPYNWLDPT
jgi:E3 ubiquitin-protein ligase BAH